MDAISFVLGVKSAQLRSSQLKDLVYRGRRLAKDNETGNGDMAEANDEEDEDEHEDGDEGEGTAKKAWVLAVYEGNDNKEYRFQRTYVLDRHLHARNPMCLLAVPQDICNRNQRISPE